MHVAEPDNDKEPVRLYLFIYSLIFILCDWKEGERTRHLPYWGMGSSKSKNGPVVWTSFTVVEFGFHCSLRSLDENSQLGRAYYWLLTIGFHDWIVFPNLSSERCENSLLRNLKQRIELICIINILNDWYSRRVYLGICLLSPSMSPTFSKRVIIFHLACHSVCH